MFPVGKPRRFDSWEDFIKSPDPKVVLDPVKRVAFFETRHFWPIPFTQEEGNFNIRRRRAETLMFKQRFGSDAQTRAANKDNIFLMPTLMTGASSIAIVIFALVIVLFGISTVLN